MHRTSFPQKRPDTHFPGGPTAQPVQSQYQRGRPRIPVEGTPEHAWRGATKLSKAREAPTELSEGLRHSRTRLYRSARAVPRRVAVLKARSDEPVGSGARSADLVGAAATEMTPESSARATGRVRGWDPEPGVRERERMPSRRIAHLSDLHAGAADDASLQRLVRAVLRSGADRVAITGDVTHRGRAAELDQFRCAFAPLLENGRAVIVPGNHDRLGDDLEAELMPGERVQVSAGHPLPLPEEDLIERLVSRLGWPNAAELPIGLELLRRVRHRCDLVLHGHRHAPAELRPFACEAPLRVFNGGSSTELQAFRVFDVEGERVDTCWIDARAEEGTANEPLRILSRAA